MASRGVTTIGHGWTMSPECWGAPEFQIYFIVIQNDITVCDNFAQKCVFKLQWAKFTHHRNNYFQNFSRADSRASRHDNTPFGTSNREWDSWPMIYGGPTRYFVQGPPSYATDGQSFVLPSRDQPMACKGLLRIIYLIYLFERRPSWFTQDSPRCIKSVPRWKNRVQTPSMWMRYKDIIIRAYCTEIIRNDENVDWSVFSSERYPRLNKFTNIVVDSEEIRFSDIKQFSNAECSRDMENLWLERWRGSRTRKRDRI